MAIAARASGEIRASLKAFLAAPTLPLSRAISFSDDDSFLEKGILDSTGVLEVVGYIEKEFGIRVEADEIIPENLDSINKLTVFVERKTGTQGPSAAA